MTRLQLVAATLAACGTLLALPAYAQVATAPTVTGGDTWTYRESNGFNRLPLGDVTREALSGPGGVRLVSRSTYDRAELQASYAQPGALASGTLNPRAQGALTPALELMSFPLEPGKTWKQTVTRQDALSGEPRRVLLEGKVIGWETVRVPAGEFRALKVERRMWLGDYDEFRGETWRSETERYAPEVRGAVKLVVFEEYPTTRYAAYSFMPGDRFIYELTSYKRG